MLNSHVAPIDVAVRLGLALIDAADSEQRAFSALPDDASSDECETVGRPYWAMIAPIVADIERLPAISADARKVKALAAAWEAGRWQSADAMRAAADLRTQLCDA